ncbi:MAG TPA: hypothetical protein VIU42_02890 [Xanthobacteraceae bacterium]
MLFLHIGRHKSGTSSIQHFFNQNRTALERDGILYPAPASGVAHHAWSATIKDVQKGLRDMSALGALRAMVDDYAASANTVVVSSEDFQDILKPELVREALGRHDVTVVAYLREHFAYAWSAYSQRVQANRFTLSFAEFLEDFSQDYLEFLNRWASAFGASSIKARIFDRSHLKSGDVVEDFCALVGIDNPGRYPRRRTANPSIGWRLINAKIEINRSLAGTGKPLASEGALYNLFEALTASHPRLAEKPVFDAEFVAAYQRRFLESDAAMARKYFGIDGSPFRLNWSGDSRWDSDDCSIPEFDETLGRPPFQALAREMSDVLPADVAGRIGWPAKKSTGAAKDQTFQTR